MSSQYLIWCVEKGRWWLPWGRGYTHQLSEAGRYSYPAAAQICDSANRFSQEPAEIMVPEEQAASFKPPDATPAQ